MRQYLARRDNVVDMNLWVSKRRRERRSTARNRERRSRRRLQLEARVLPFRRSEKEQDGHEVMKLRVAGSADPDLPEAS